MDPHQQFCLKWNSYSSNLAITFSNLFKSDVLTDVTLACEGSLFKAHKLILAACSKKFADIFANAPTYGQCVVLLEATSSKHMAALLEFMYKGEVQVSHEALNDFLKSAENLQVKGLSTETGRLTAQRAQQQMETSTPVEPTTSSSHSALNSSNINGNHNNNTSSNIHNNICNLGNENLCSGGGENGGGHMTGNGNTSNISCGLNTSSGSAGGAVSDSGNGSGINNITYGLGSGTAAATVAAAAASAAGPGLGLPEHCQNMGGIISGPPLVGMTGNINNEPPIALNNNAGPPIHHVRGPGMSMGNLKQECDSLMHPSSSTLCAMPTYVPPPIYRPMSYEPLRKRALRSPYAEQEIRGSVLRDGSKNPSDCASPITGTSYHRPTSSASSTTPTEPDTMHCERASPESSRYENHSPNTTGNSNCHVPSSMDESLKSEHKNGCPNRHHNDNDEHDDLDNSRGASAEDLRVKLENSNYSPSLPQTTNASPVTPSGLLDGLKTTEGTLSGSLAASVAPADMLNVWNATKLNNKDYVEVMTPEGKKLKCLFCDRLYGYETNLRAHIRQRHQGIRVPCPYCSRTFTRNNTVRRHIAREHKHELALSAGATIAPANLTASAAAAAAAAAATISHSK